jgi:hypothetical protein
MFKPVMPLLVPLTLGILASGYVMISAQVVRHALGCDLSLPWDQSTSIQILRSLFPVALEEFSLLSTLSTKCVAELHIHITAAYSVVFATTLTLSLAMMPKTKAGS